LSRSEHTSPPSSLLPYRGGGQDSTQHSQQILDYGTAYRHVVADLSIRVNALRDCTLSKMYNITPPTVKNDVSTHRIFGFPF